VTQPGECSLDDPAHGQDGKGILELLLAMHAAGLIAMASCITCSNFFGGIGWCAARRMPTSTGAPATGTGRARCPTFYEASAVNPQIDGFDSVQRFMLCLSFPPVRDWHEAVYPAVVHGRSELSVARVAGGQPLDKPRPDSDPPGCLGLQCVASSASDHLLSVPGRPRTPKTACALRLTDAKAPLLQQTVRTQADPGWARAPSTTSTRSLHPP
jgi:hypothetical protein